MEIRYTLHARDQMQERRITETHVGEALANPEETFTGISITGAWVYHKRVGRRRIYVLVEPYSDPMVVISVRPWKPIMRTP